MSSVPERIIPERTLPERTGPERAVSASVAPTVEPPDGALPATESSISLGRRFLHPQTLVSFALGLAIIAFVFSRLQIDVKGTLHVISTANWALFVTALLVYYLAFPLRGYRWGVMLRNAGATSRDIPSVLGLTDVIFLSWFANCAVPAKLGDVYRAYLLRQRSAVSLSKAGGTIVAERVIDLSILLILMGVTALLSFPGRLPGSIVLALEAGAALVVVAGIVLLSLRRLDAILRPLVPHRFHGIYDHFLEGTLGSFGNYPVLIGVAMLAWAAEAGRLFFVTQSLGVRLSPNPLYNLTTIAFIALGSALLTALPGTPAGLGYVETTLGWVLIGLVGMDPNQAISVVLLDRSISYGSIVVFGFVAYLVSFRHVARVASSPVAQSARQAADPD